MDSGRSDERPMNGGRGRWLYLLGLVALLSVAAVFSLGVTGGRVGLDDWGYTSGCPFVRGGLNWANVSRAFSDFGYGAIWMPVTFVSYMADVSLFGDSWRAYHAVNVGLHVLTALLVFLFLKAQLRLLAGASGKSAWLAALVAALVWAVHPMRAESVTYVAGRKEELWTLFSLAGFLAYGRYLRVGKGWSYALAWIGFVMACLSKPTAMVFPFLAGAMQVAYRARLKGEGRAEEQQVPSFWKIVPMAVFAGLIGLVALYSQSHPTASASVDVYATSFGWRLLNAAVSVGLYCWYTVVPYGVHMDYRAVFGGMPVDGMLGLSVLAVVVAATVFAFVRLSRDGRIRLAYAGAFFLLALGPTLGVLGFVNGDHAMADRYTYMAHVGLALLLAFGLAALRRWYLLLACGVFVVFEVALAIPVVCSYSTGYTVFSRVLAKDPNHWRGLRFVGRELCTSPERMDEGVAMLKRSLVLRESQSTAEVLAYSLAIRNKTGDFDEVNRLCAGVIQKPSRDQGGMMLDALGIVAMREARYAMAAGYFAAGLRVRNRNHAPDHAVLNLGLCLANIGKDQEALAILKNATACRHPWVRQRAEKAMEEIRKGGERPPFLWE
ncbi:MAG: tetratricopeptide repeat protein [Kiritimatiellia bacterium]|nr:tetratricopeptide repeat protein [Kiritimatiellia bacterium]